MPSQQQITTIKVIIILTKIVFNDAISCEQILELPEDSNISIVDLRTMQPKDIIECLAHLSKDQLAPEEADFIWQTIVNEYGGIQNIPDGVLTILHYVTIAITPEDYTNISLSNVDVIENFGLYYNLNKDQLQAITDKVREDFAGKEPEDYTYYDLIALKQILCQLNASEIERIHPAAYREAAIMIGKLKDCSSNVMSAFALLAMQPAAFGSPNGWTDKTIKAMGQVAEFLPNDILNKFKVDSDEEH